MAMRGLVERTQNDLRRAEGVERKQGKQVDRYEHAQRNLSDFDRRMTDGHFDKDKLNNVIEEVKDVVDHNTLQPNLQNALKNDLMDLKQMSMLHSEH